MRIATGSLRERKRDAEQRTEEDRTGGAARLYESNYESSRTRAENDAPLRVHSCPKNPGQGSRGHAGFTVRRFANAAAAAAFVWVESSALVWVTARI